MSNHRPTSAIQSLQLIVVGLCKLVGGALLLISWVTGLLGRILHP